MVDESTFESFYERTKHSLRAFILRTMKNEALASDIFQDAYIRFLQSNVTSQNESQMRSYLFRITVNLMKDYWRKTKREWRTASDHSPAEQSTGRGNEPDLSMSVDAVFEQLTPQQRSLLWLAYVEGWGHKEIAGMLKLREKSVKVLLFRAKQRFMEVGRQIGIATEDLV